MKERPVQFVEAVSAADSASHESSLSAKLLEAQDKERRKISRELHDSVGQSLTAAKMAIAALKTKLRKSDLAAADEIEQLVDGALTEVRTVSYLLHPPLLDLVGLRSSILWYAEGFQQRTGIRTSVEIPERLPQLESGTETALFRIVQESLVNVHKHARASAVVISVAVASDELQVRIHDNGVGFGDTCNEGVGIAGMRERLRELNGALQVDSSKHAGSSVRATIPLSNSRVSIDPDDYSVPSAPSSGHRILLVDDHEIVRRGVRSLLASEPDLEICGEASNAKEAVESAEKLRPDITVLDLQMSGENGWSVVRKLREKRIASKVLILSQYDLPQNFVKASGCSGFVSKSRASSDLVTAIRAALAGDTFFKGSKLPAHR